MSKIIPLTGDQAVAYAMKQIEPDVVAAYPITPQTAIVMSFSNYVANGQVSTELIPVESEHSAMSACVGAAAAGARTMTATSANGLALMWEIVYIAASTRLPMVMPVVNRALSGPINIHCDHSDTMGARDSGWIQIYCENAQEVYENTILAVRIAEHKNILLPVMVCQDGFITSHGVEGVKILDDKKVKDFIGEYKIENPLLDVDNPVTYGPLDLQDYYFEHKRQQGEAMKSALSAIPEVLKEFEKTFGTKYDFIEYLATELREKILAVKDLSYTEEFGLQELVERSKDVLANEEVMGEKKIMNQFLTLLAKTPGKAGYGEKEVYTKLELGAVDILLLSESLNDETIDKFELKAKELGSEVRIISVETREGVQLRDLGKVAAIYRYDVGE